MPFIYLAMTYVKSHKNCKGKKIIFKWNKFEIVKKILEEKCKYLEVKIKIWKLKLGHCKILRILGLSLEFWKVEKPPMGTWHVAVPHPLNFLFFLFFLFFFSNFLLLLISSLRSLSLLHLSLMASLEEHHPAAALPHAPATQVQRAQTPGPSLPAT